MLFMAEENELKPLWVAPETHQQIKILAAQKGMTIKKFLEEQFGEENGKRE